MTDKPKKQTFRLFTDSIKANALAFVALLPVGQDWEIECRVRRLTREQAQNALYWVWLTHFADQIGSTKDELHTKCKRRFLKPIYERDFPETKRAIVFFREQGDEELQKWVIDMMSTTKLSVAQFSEYLNDIEFYFAAKGYPPPACEWDEFR